MKYHLRRLEIREDYPSYNDSSKEMAIVIPLYDALWQNDWKGIIDPAYINGSVNAAKSLILNTDVVARRIPIYFFIEDSVAYGRLHEFWNAGIKSDRIRTFNSPPSDIVKFRLSKKFYALLDPVLKEYDNIVVWDADLFACCKLGMNKKLDTKFMQGKGVGAMYCGGSHYIDKQAHWWDKWGLPKDRKDFEKNFEISKAKIHSVYPEIELGRYVQFPNMLAGVLRFAQPIPDEFEQFVFTLEPLVGDEELIMALWMHYSGDSIDSLDMYKQGIAWTPDLMYEIREKGAYWAHVGDDTKEEASWEADWRKDIGYDQPITTHAAPPNLDNVVAQSSILPDVAVLNLKRRPDRKESFLKGLRDLGYSNNVSVIRAMDSQEYEDRDALLRATMKEYPTFETLISCPERLRVSHWDIHQWSYLRCLKWISLQDNYIVMFEDDMTLNITWSNLLRHLRQLPQDFNMALLNYNHHPYNQKELVSYGTGWEVGSKSNSTTAIVFSPECARVLHDEIVSNISVSAEMHIKGLDIKMDGIYSAVPVVAVTLPEAGVSDLTPLHNK